MIVRYHPLYNRIMRKFSAIISVLPPSKRGNKYLFAEIIIIPKAFKAKHAIQDYVFTDGTANHSVERRFVEDLDAADEVIVYAKLPRGPRGFYIPTPVGNYSPDWAISFKKGAVKHIFFIAETKGSMKSTRFGEMSRTDEVERAKISCAKKLFNEISTSGVKYHDVDSYQTLLNIIETL